MAIDVTTALAGKITVAFDVLEAVILAVAAALAT
jgi:hypothetical protein